MVFVMETSSSTVTGGKRATRFGTLRRFAVSRNQPVLERCELCSIGLAPEHRHLLETASHKIICWCDPCALRFENVIDGRFKLILRDAQWDDLALPIEDTCPELAGFEVEGIKVDECKAANTCDHFPSAAPEWMQIENAEEIASDSFISLQTETEPLLICKAGDKLYAYRDHCAACNFPLHLGMMKEGLLTCSLGHRFDIRRAGSSLDAADLHLDPLPLLVQDGLVKVALTRTAGANHQPHAESLTR